MKIKVLSLFQDIDYNLKESHRILAFEEMELVKTYHDTTFNTKDIIQSFVYPSYIRFFYAIKVTELNKTYLSNLLTIDNKNLIINVNDILIFSFSFSTIYQSIKKNYLRTITYYIDADSFYNNKDKDYCLKTCKEISELRIDYVSDISEILQEK